MYTKLFEFLNKDKVLVIVDAQKRFVNKRFINKLFEYSKNFETVYQLYFDDYYGIYDDDIRVDGPDYEFPNEKGAFAKGLNIFDYILDKVIWDEEVEEALEDDEYEIGTILKLPEDSHLSGYETIKIRSNQWFLLDDGILKLLDLVKDKEVILVGGFKDECLLDIYVTMKTFNINVEINEKYVF